ncbi:hypothetical protein PLICRDRAFT_103761 [Plicaturopsis crispa FD-325 SS-3]|nr:hypothetical protein PLICRDRAFT_103761 [Plicaturopsis crispa FD-325 SS-3]
MKSSEDYKHLRDVILDPDFSPDDIRGVNFAKLHAETGSSTSDFFSAGDGWSCRSVDIGVPFGSRLHPPRKFNVGGVQIKSIVNITRAVFSSPESQCFHYVPYTLLWSPPGVDVPPQPVHGELYTSPAFRTEHDNIQCLFPPPDYGPNLPRAVAAIMLWSDSTHLTNFGSALLWPQYLQFGNQSKYDQCRPSSHAFHHVAYMPKLPATIHKFITKVTGKAGSTQLITHCHRELMHGIMKLLFEDEEFLYAYEHGIIVHCSDGFWRRLYLRLFTYSADYPEKVLLATIRDKGFCPCPRCLVQKKDIYLAGTRADIRVRVLMAKKSNENYCQQKVLRARKFIYQDGYVVNSKMVENLLQGSSLVSTTNTFSSLRKFGLQYPRLFVPDEIHEWDIGEVKKLIIHLIRILHVAGKDAVNKFNSR